MISFFLGNCGTLGTSLEYDHDSKQLFWKIIYLKLVFLICTSIIINWLKEYTLNEMNNFFYNLKRSIGRKMYFLEFISCRKGRGGIFRKGINTSTWWSIFPYSFCLICWGRSRRSVQYGFGRRVVAAVKIRKLVQIRKRPRLALYQWFSMGRPAISDPPTAARA